MKAFDSEAPSDLDVHARTLLKSSPEAVESRPPGPGSKHCFNVHPTSLQDALLVSQSSDPGHFRAHYLPLKKSLH